MIREMVILIQYCVLGYGSFQSVASISRCLWFEQVVEHLPLTRGRIA